MPVSQAELRLLITAQDRAQQIVTAAAATIDRVTASVNNLGQSRGFQQAAQGAQQLGSAVQSIGQGNPFTNLINGARQFGQAAQQAAQQSKLMSNISMTGGAGGGNVSNGVSSALTGIQNAFRAAQQQAAQASGAIGQSLMAIGNAARGVAGGVAGGLSAAMNGLQSLVGGVRGVAGSIANLGQSSGGIQTATQNVNGFTASIRNMIAVGAGIVGVQSAITIMHTAFSAVADAAIGFNSQLENARIAFTGIFKDGQKAQAFIIQLQDFAARTAFEFPGLLHMAQMLVGVGMDAENVLPLLKAVAGAMTAAGRTQADIQGVGLALQQVFTAGKVNAQDMNQLIQRGIPAWRVMAEAVQKTGEPIETAIARVKELSKQGKITSADFFAAFEQYAKNHDLANIAESAVASFSGALSNLGDGFRNLVSSAAEPAFTRISALIQGVANALTSDAARQFGLDLKATAEDAIRSLEPLGMAFQNIFKGFQTGGVKGALDAIIGMFDGLSGGMQDAGVQLMQSYAEGIVQGASDLIEGAVNFVADLIASFLIGNSPPPSGPLSQIDQGGRNVALAWMGGLGEGFQGIDQILVGIADAFGNVGKQMSLGQVEASFSGAKGSLTDLKAAAEDAEGALRNLNGIQRELDREQSSLTSQVENIKSSYGEQTDALQRNIDAIKEQNTLEEKKADLIQKQSDAITRQADLRDKVALNELKAAQIAAEGDPVKRAELVKQQALLKANEDDLKLRQREQDLNRADTEAGKKQADYQEAMAKWEKAKAEAKKAGREFDTKAPTAPDPKDQALAREKLRLDREQLVLDQQLNALTDKGKLAEYEAAKAVIERNAALRHASEERVKAGTDAIKNAADIERAQKDIQALPLEQQLEAIKKEQEDQLRPIQQRLQHLQQEERQLGAIRKEWQGIKQDIADAVQAQTATETAAKAAAKKAGSAPGTSALFPGGRPDLERQEVDTSVLDRVGHSMAQGVGDAFNKNIGAIIFGGLGAVLGGMAFGPLGLAVGAAFGAQVGAAVQKQVPQLSTIFADAGRTFFQAFAGGWDGQGDEWISPLVRAAGEAGIAFRFAADTIAAAWNALKGPVGAVMDWMRQNTGLVAAALTGLLVPAFSLLLSVVGGVVRPIIGLLAPLSPAILAVSAAAVLLKLAWDNNFGGIRDTVAAALPPIMSALKTLQATLILISQGDWGAALIGLQVAMGQLSAAIGPILAGIGQAILDQVAQWAPVLWQWIVDATPGVLTALGQLILQIAAWIAAQLPVLAAQLVVWADAFFAWIAPAIPLMITGLALIAAQLIAWIGQQIPPIVAQLTLWANEFFAWIAPMIPPMLTALALAAAALLGWIAEQIPPIVAQLLLWAQQFVAWVAPFIPPMLAALGAMIAQLFAWIVQQVPGIVTQLLLWAEEFIAWVAPQIPVLLVELGKFALAMLDWIIEQTPKVVAEWVKVGIEFGAWILTTAIPELVKNLPKIQEQIVTWFGTASLEVGKRLVSFGQALVKGIYDGFTQAWADIGPQIVEKITSAFQLPEWLGGKGTGGTAGGLTGSIGNLSSGSTIDPAKVANIPLSINPAKGQNDVLVQWAPVLRAIEESGGPLARNIAAVIMAENGAGNSDLVRNSKNWFSITAVESRRARGLQAGTDQGGRFAKYDSDAQALADFLDLIMNNPNQYGDAWNSRRGPVESFVPGLIKGGYINGAESSVPQWQTNLSAGAKTYDNATANLPQMPTTSNRGGGSQGNPQAQQAFRAAFQQTQQQWDKDMADANDICGPHLAALFAGAVGRPPSVEEARAIAVRMGMYNIGPNGRGSGITNAAAYPDYANAVIQSMNPGTGQHVVAKTPTGIADATALGSQALASGSPLVGFNTANHYFGATQFNPENGQFNVGGTGRSLAGGSDWMSVADMTRMEGAVSQVLMLVGQTGDAFAGMGEKADQATSSTATGVTDDQTAAAALQPTVDAVTAAQQQYAETLSGEVAPAGLVVGTSVQQMSAAITPLLGQIASGSITTDDLVQQLALMAANTQLTTQPLLGLATGTMTAQQAMTTLFDAASALDPQFGVLGTSMQATDADAQTMAVTFAEGIGNGTGVATAALTQMGASIDPLVAQVAAGQQEGGALEQTLVQLASSTGLTIAPFRQMQDGVIDSNTALRAVIKQAATAGPGFEELSTQIGDNGPVTREAALQFLQLVAAYKTSIRPIDQAAKGTEAVATAVEATSEPVAQLTTDIATQAAAGAEALATVLPDGAKAAIDNVRALAGEAESAGQEIGAALVAGMESGIQQAAERVASAAADVVKKAVEAAKSEAKAESPSRVTMELGRNISEGLAIGTEQGSSGAVDAATKSVSKVVTGMRNEARAHSPSEKTRDLGRNMNEGVQIGQTEDVGYVEDAARGVIASALDAMRDEADAHSPSGEGVRIGKDILKGLAKGLRSSKTSDIAKEQIKEYLQVAGNFDDSFAKQLEIAVNRTQLNIAGSTRDNLEATLAVKDAQEAIEKAAKGTWQQQVTGANIATKQAEIQKQLAEGAQTDLDRQNALRDVSGEQDRIRKGSLLDQVKVADLEAQQTALSLQSLGIAKQTADLSLQEAESAQASLGVRQELAAAQKAQQDAAKGTLDDQMRLMEISHRSAEIALEQAKAERELLPLKTQTRDLQKQIESATKGALAAQQAAIRLEATQAAARIEQLQIQDRLALGEDTGGGMSQEDINKLQERNRALQQAADSNGRQAEIQKLQTTIATAADRERLLALQDQLDTRQESLVPLADEKATLDAEGAVIAANNTLASDGYDLQIFQLQTQVETYDAIAQKLADTKAGLDAQSAVLDAQSAILGVQKDTIQATNELRATALDQLVISWQMTVDQDGLRKQALQDQLDTLGNQKAMIDATTALEASRLQNTLLANQEVLDTQMESQRALERQLEIQQAQTGVISAQVALANALKQALTDAGVIQEKTASSSSSKSSSSKSSKSSSSSKKKALGGQVSFDDLLLVGEGGPEIFVPPHDGTILNNATTERLMSAVGMVAPRMESTLRQRAVGGNVWGGRSYLVGEGSGVEGYAPWSPRGGMPGTVMQPIKVVQATVNYHVHEQQRSGEARVERVVLEAVQYASNTG